MAWVESYRKYCISHKLEISFQLPLSVLSILVYCLWTFVLTAVVSASVAIFLSASSLQTQHGICWFFRSPCLSLCSWLITYSQQEESLLTHRTKLEKKTQLWNVYPKWIKTEIWPRHGDSATYGRRQACSDQGRNNISCLGLTAWTETSIQISAMPHVTWDMSLTPSVPLACKMNTILG